jgi:hypothetical protein
VPPAPGMKSPSLWGTKAHLDTLFGPKGSVAAESKNFLFRYPVGRDLPRLLRFGAEGVRGDRA